jgi:flagellar export protein FliJ
MRETLRRFVGLKTIADHREARAAQSLAASLAKLEAMQAELARLSGYADEYQRGTRGLTTDSARMRNLASFNGELAAVIGRLEADVALATRTLHADLDRWRDGFRRSKGFEQLVEKYRSELAQLEAAREQKELDERASRHRPDDVGR